MIQTKRMTKSKMLVIGASGYLGNYMARASISLGHPTFAFVRPFEPNTINTQSSKQKLLNEFESIGVTVFQGELDDHDKLVWVLKQVDIVISTLAVPQYNDQLKLIAAIKEAGNIKRFIPSEYGNEVDRVRGLPPFQAVLDIKKNIRRAVEASSIPFTFVSANSFTAYFIDFLLHPHDKNVDHVTIYGTGQTKTVLNYEEDVAMYTVKAATDERVANRVIIYRPTKNIVSQMDIVSTWEKKTGKTLKKTYIPEEDIIKLTETLPFPDNIPVAILHNIFIKGAQLDFELTDDDLEASKLYPDYKYTSVYEFLDICLVNPPITKLTALS